LPRIVFASKVIPAKSLLPWGRVRYQVCAPTEMEAGSLEASLP